MTIEIKQKEPYTNPYCQTLWESNRSKAYDFVFDFPGVFSFDRNYGFNNVSFRAMDIRRLEERPLNLSPAKEVEGSVLYKDPELDEIVDLGRRNLIKVIDYQINSEHESNSLLRKLFYTQGKPSEEEMKEILEKIKMSLERV